MKKELNYGSHIENGFVIIVPLAGGESVYTYLDEVLAGIETRLGSLARKHIICEGHDGFWDLILPGEKLGLTQAKIYPLNALNLEQAKVKIHELKASGQIGG